jgi:uncharacterized protein YyaL (SSP411 family)
MKPLILLKRVNSSWRRLYSSLDADSEGEEGKYYVWTAEELTAILGQEAPYFLIIITVQKWKLKRKKNILFRKSADKAIATKYKISLETLDRKIKESSTKLLSARAKRVKPRLDDKILTAWNGLMLKATLLLIAPLTNLLF